MNPCILITSHLNNSDKVEVAHNLVDSLQDKGLPIIFVGNFPIPQELQQKVDYTLNVKENPVANRSIVWWEVHDNFLNSQDTPIALHRIVWDYGYAHLHQSIKGFKLCQSLGYDYVYHFNYDVEITNDNFTQILDRSVGGNCLLFPWGDLKRNAATNIYCIKTIDFLSSLEPLMSLYLNGNPPIGPHPVLDIAETHDDWYCETFFRWALMQNSITPPLVEDISFKTLAHSSKYDITTPFGKFDIYYNKTGIKHSKLGEEYYALLFEEPLLSSISLRTKKEEVPLIPTFNPRIFLLKSIEDNYYYKDKLIFTPTKRLKNDYTFEYQN